MAIFWAQATIACTKSARTVCSVSLAQRSFQLRSFAAATHIPFANGIRHGSGLATAQVESRHNLQDSQPTVQEEKNPLSFSSLEGVVSKNVLRAIVGQPMSLTTMSPVQAEVFPLLPQLARPYNPQEPADGPPRDILVKAKTGTGKTLGFLVPAVEARLQSIEAHTAQALRDAGQESDKAFAHRTRMVFGRETVGTLIISPTRELASQIAKEAIRLTSHLDGFGVRLFVGGESKGMQLRQWANSRRDIVVATPGRLRDVLQSVPEVERSIAKTQVFILDEADTLLDMGFQPDIDAIKEYLPRCPERQNFLFSATVSDKIQQIAKSTLAPNYKFINCVSSDASPVHADIPQYHTILPSAKEQIPHLMRLLAHDQLTNPGASKVIVFLPTTKMTQLFSTAVRELAKTTLPAGRNTVVYEIHSKRTMESRTRASNLFRADASGASILITSDVSARGVDYPNVSRVIQVGIPGSSEQYVHRVGRTGRGSNKKGRGDIMLLPWEMGFVRQSLSKVPLKPLTYSDLAAQVTQLAKEFDSDPAAFFAGVPAPPAPARGDRDRRYTPTPIRGPKLFQSNLAGITEELERTTDTFKMSLDEEAVRETFMANLGFYVTKSTEMRARKEDILEGLKTWTTEGLGLPTPPYVSPRMLAQMGAGDIGRSRKSFGVKPLGRNSDYNRPPRQNSWEERGQQRVRSNRDGGFGGGYGSRDSGFRDSRRQTRDGEEGGYRGRDTYSDRSGRSGGYGGRREEKSQFW